MIDLTSIPRTRARITRYARRTPFDGLGSVWSSGDEPTVPVYEKTSPYAEKLPADLLQREMHEITLRDTLAFALAADRPDRVLDRMIWYKVVFDPAIEAGKTFAKVGTPVPGYTASLDAALLLYDARPPMIETDPLDVVCDALRLRLLTCG